jgi:hypothetical protein
MNKRQIVASLNKIANELDTNGLFNEANEVTEVMLKLSQSLIGNSGFGAGGNVPLGIDPSMVPTMPKPYEAQGPKNPIYQEAAENWISTNSNLVGGDINKLVSLALKGKEQARDPQQKKKFNDALFILQNHPKYKAKSGLGNVRSMDRNPEADSSLGGVRSYEGAQEAKAKKFPY